jgi:hypothetical protein
VRRALGEQPVVGAAGGLAPAAIGVVGRLLGQHHEVVAEVDGAVVVTAHALGSSRVGAHERQDYPAPAGPAACLAVGPRFARSPEGPSGALVASADPGRATLVASDGVTTPSGTSPPDDYWRRPVPDEPADPPGHRAVGATGAGTDPTAGQAGRAGSYAGPPPTTPPPPGWRPPVHLQVAAPRHLPPQDMADMDGAEQRAQRLTWSIGAVAGVVLVLLVCLLCSRAIF